MTDLAAAPAETPTRWARFSGALSRFWFAPMRASTFVLFRSALAVTVLVWMIALLPDLKTFFGESGLRPNPIYAEFRYGLFQWFQSDTALVVVYVSTLVAASMVLAGRLVRVAAPAMWVGVMSFQLDNLSILNAGDELLRIWCAYFAIYALITPNAITSRSLGSLFGPDRDDAVAPMWLLRVVQIQMTIIYPASVIAKLDGDRWHDGTAALYAFQLEDFKRFWVPDVVADNLVVGWVLTYGTLLLEVLIPVMLWIPRTRRVAIVAGIALHVGFDYAMRLGFFAWSMTIGYIAFLTASEADWVLRRLPFSRTRVRRAARQR